MRNTMPDSPVPETGSEQPRSLGETQTSGQAGSVCPTSEGVEIRLYDPGRKPQNWTEVMRPS